MATPSPKFTWMPAIGVALVAGMIAAVLVPRYSDDATVHLVVSIAAALAAGALAGLVLSRRAGEREKVVPPR
ncbi:MAG: hypothetical protein ACK41D_09130 [Rubricoccaceae bacterium]